MKSLSNEAIKIFVGISLLPFVAWIAQNQSVCCMCCASFTIQIDIDLAYVNMVLTNSVKEIPRPMDKFSNKFSFIEAVKQTILIKRNTYIAGIVYWSQSLSTKTHNGVSLA